MTIALTSQPPRYRAWNPTAQQFHEPDTLYLMDLAVEAQLAPALGGMFGGHENFSQGAVAHRAPWLGGTQVAVVAGKYRDGLHPLTTDTAWLIKPNIGLLPLDQFTIELFVKSSVAWSALGQAPIMAVQSDALQRVRLSTFNTTMTAQYMHDQSSVGLVNRNFTYGHAGAAGTWYSMALTLSGQTLRLYVDGVLRGSVAGCTPPVFHGDNVTLEGGVIVCMADSNGPGAANLTVSDLRISRLARVPGQAPA